MAVDGPDAAVAQDVARRTQERLEAVLAHGRDAVLLVDVDGNICWASGAMARVALEIDRSFVSGLAESLEDRAIVEGIIGLAHAVGLVTVAEGVESEAQCRELRQLGSDWAQGYLWSKPVPASELQAWLASTGCSLVEGWQDPA